MPLLRRRNLPLTWQPTMRLPSVHTKKEGDQNVSNSFDAQSAIGRAEDATNLQVQHHLDSLLGRIPGYRGYRDKEDRRDADRAIRDQIITGLDAAGARVERVARDLANRRQLTHVTTVDQWVQ